MKRNKFRLLVLGGVLIMGILILQACKKSFLDAQPYGEYSADLVNNQKGLEAKLVGVYGILDGQGVTSTWAPSATNWATAGVCADDAYKGTDANDQPQMTEVEQYKSQPANPYFYDKWVAVYEGVARANVVIKSANDPKLVIDAAEKTNVIAQARFLRGHFHFEAKKMWNKVPYISDTTSSYNNATDIWPSIEADFKFAYDNLPETQDLLAKANKWAAGCYLAKSYLYEKKFTEAKALYDVITMSGKTAGGRQYGLQDAYWKNFDASYENSGEEVFGIATEASGTVDQSGEASMGLAFPYGGDFGCCGFFQPSQNLVNAYKTGVDGLPLPTTFNNSDLKNDQGLKDADAYSNDAVTPLDPRLDWSVGRRGVPYWDWGPHPGYSWIRDQNYAGPFSPKKHVYSKKDRGILTSSGWKNVTAKDYYLIKYSDVLLMAAEAEIEVGSLARAQSYINQVRARAKNPVSWVPDAPANYVINTYSAPFTSQDAARTAVRFERRLELAEEGHRFFDLVRWGIAAETLNTYLATEKMKRTYKSTATFTKGKNEYFPIPASIIDVAKKYGNVLDQNPGY